MINGINFKLISDNPKREVDINEDKAKSGGWGNEFPPAFKIIYLKIITKINVKIINLFIVPTYLNNLVCC